MKKHILYLVISAIPMIACAQNSNNNDLVLDLPTVKNSQPIDLSKIENLAEQSSFESSDSLNTGSTDFNTPQPSFDSTPIAEILQNSPDFVMWNGKGIRLKNPQEILNLYEQMSFQALWLEGNSVTKLAQSLIKESVESWTHALSPQTYHSEELGQFVKGQKVQDSPAFDILLTDAFISLKKHLTNGIVDPQAQFDTWSQKPETINFTKLYILAQNLNSVRKTLVVKNSDYKLLRKEYIKAFKSNAQTKKTIKIPVKSLKFGSASPDVITLRKRLNIAIDSDVYDESVREAVMNYQAKNGLTADGLAGGKTIAHLNGKGVNKSPQNIAINMERIRWNRSEPSGLYVSVNIPAFNMNVRRGRDFMFESNVVVGRSKRKTPVFSDTLKYVVLAPYWNVPKTIFKEDKLPKLIKNPNAFGSSMQVIDKATGKVVDASSVDWTDGAEGFRLRQVPGKSNALGRMKFLFPNRHAIYLHDTPQKKLFKKSVRAFSSGCIRVEKANDFAEFLLDDLGYNSKRITKESNGKKEKWITLNEDKKYPVYINYYTVWANKDGKVQYSSDVYGYDKKLKAMYKSALERL